MSESQPITEQERGPKPIYKILIMSLPIGVVIGTIVFMFMYFYLERKNDEQQSVIVTRTFRLSSLDDMVNKLTKTVGYRSIETEEGRNGLKRAESMIGGMLGPQNLGLTVSKSSGEAAHGLLWKGMSVDILGQEKPREVVFIAASYAGDGGVADANCVSSVVLLASSIARDKPERTLRFIFTPLDKEPLEQSEWLVEQCLKSNETCAGIIGLDVMDKEPGVNDSDWLMINETSDQAQVWWSYLSGKSSSYSNQDGEIPSVWLTHTVFSPIAWKESRLGRLEETAKIAPDIKSWVMKAASY